MTTKSRAMTGAERKRKSRAKLDNEQVNITLAGATVLELDRQAKLARQTRSELITALIIQAGKPKSETKPVTRPKKKRTPKRKKVEAPQPTLDAIGLARPESFRNFAGAVSMSPEVKDVPNVNMKTGKRETKWRSLPRKYISVGEAQEHIEAFKKTHSDAIIDQKYKLDKTLLDITATYSDDRPDHRVVYQARNR